MSVEWGGSPQPQVASAEGDAAVTDPSGAWAVLADSFPEWTLEPPLVLAPRRPPAS